MVTREQLIQVRDLPEETVHVPELNATVRLRGMTGRDLLSFTRALELGKKNGVSAVDEEGFPAKLLVRCIVNESGERVLQDEDWRAVLEWPGTMMQRLTAVAFKLCGYGESGNP